jgi:hypothetical protein
LVARGVTVAVAFGAVAVALGFTVTRGVTVADGVGVADAPVGALPASPCADGDWTTVARVSTAIAASAVKDTSVGRTHHRAPRLPRASHGPATIGSSPSRGCHSSSMARR